MMGDSDETQAQKPGEENVKCCAECKPVKREKKPPQLSYRKIRGRGDKS